MTIRFKGLMKWQDDPTWYDLVDGQWVLTDKAPEAARENFGLYMEEMRRYEDLKAKLFEVEDDTTLQ